MLNAKKHRKCRPLLLRLDRPFCNLHLMSPPSVFKVESQIPEMLFKPKIRVFWSRSFSLDEQKVSLMTSTVMWWELYTSLPLNCGYFGSCWFWRLPFTVALWSDTVASCFFFFHNVHLMNPADLAASVWTAHALPASTHSHWRCAFWRWFLTLAASAFL